MRGFIQCSMTPHSAKKVKSDQTLSQGTRVVKLRMVGKRLDQVLTDTLKGVSREEVKGLIRAGTVFLNGQVAIAPDTRVALGDTLRWDRVKVSGLSTQQARLGADDAVLRVQVMAETEDFLVVNKPAGLAMHPVGKTGYPTVTQWISTRYPQIVGVGEVTQRPGMVHRLDKDTSGLVLIAKHQKAFMALKSLFQQRKIVKEYLALVYGTLSLPSGVQSQPIGRVKGGIRRATPVGKRVFGGELREAITEYSLHTRYPQYDLLSLKPKTGRTHQLRVHVASLGHPIVGDRLYRFKEHRTDALRPPYQLLHAAKIQFQLFGKKYRFEAPLPAYYQDILSILSLKKAEESH